MKTGTFMDLISIHYKEIKTSFKSRSLDKTFDEDAFNDAFIKCANHFGNEILDYDTVVKYFFTAYKNTRIANECKEQRIMTEELDSEVHDCYEELDEHFEYAQYVYDNVMNAIADEYSENDMMIYSLYKYHKWKLQDLIDAGYDCTDFDNKVDEIHKFTKNYCKDHFKKGRK